MSDLIGVELGGYRVTSYLARGGFAEAYLVEGPEGAAVLKLGRERGGSADETAAYALADATALVDGSALSVERDAVDAILLADVVYGSNPEAWSALARTLRRLCGPETAVVLSHTRRAGVGRDAFLRAARREGLEARRATRERRDAGELGTSVTETYVLWLAKG